MVVSALGGPEDNSAAAADAAEATDSAALAAELADAAATEVAANATAQDSAAAPGIDVKPDVEDASMGAEGSPVHGDEGVPPVVADAASTDGVKAEGLGDPPGLIPDGTGGSGPAGDERPQPGAVVKPDLAELDAAHDTVVAAAAEGDAADVRAAAKIDAKSLDAAGGSGTDPTAGTSAGSGPNEMPSTAADLSEVKAEILENAEASAPAGADAAAAEPAEAQRRSSRGTKKRTRWGDDPDEPGDEADGGAERAVKVKTEPQSIGTV